jgi:hypothetical protein
MGVPASGATLEIQLVADVARLQSDMKAMQDVVSNATAGAGKSFAGMSAQTVNSATLMAAAAQASARAATTGAAGVATMGAASGLARVQLLELSHVATSLSGSLIAGQNPLRALAVELPRIAQAASFGGSGIKGLIASLLEMTGVITITRDAELTEAAAMKAAAAQAIRSRAERTAATLEARNVEVALAQAQLAAATTADAEAAAQTRLVKALRAVELAAGKSTIANQALATANGEAAAAAQASNAKTVLGLGRVGIALGTLAIIAGVAFAGIKSFQDEVGRSGELDKFAEGLRLTDAQIEKAGGKVKYLADGTREITGLTVSWGNIAQATWQVLAERAGLSAKSISEGFTSALKWIGEFGKFTVAVLIASFASLIALILSLGANLGKLATGKFDQLTNPLADVKKQFLTTFNDVNAGFDKIGQRSKDLAKAQLQAESDSNKPPKGKKPKKESDHGLAQALAELDAQIKGQLRLAEAYQVSDAAAIKAEALQKAEEQAIRHKGEVGVFYEKELALAIATRAAEGAKLINQLSGQTAAQKAANDAVASGTIDASQASQFMQNEAQLRPLIAAATLAEGKAKDILTGVIARLRIEQKASNDEASRAQVLSATAAANDNIDKLELETKLIGENNAVRAVAIARLEAEQFLRAHPMADADAAQAYIDAAVVLADKTAGLTTAQDNYNKSLSYTADLLGLIDQQAQTVGQSLSDAFGGVGEGIATALTALTGYAAAQAKIDQDHLAAMKAAGGNAKTLANEEILYAKKSSIARQAATMQVLGGLKSLFKEHSTGYKVMTAIEKAYAVFQAVQTVIAIARDIAHTTSSVANSAVRTTANTAEGGSKIFAQLGVWAFPVVAAMVAILAALGAKGGGGGGSAPSIPSAEDIQAANGAGTVLGDSAAKSESIKHALEIVAANSNKDLEYSNQMLRSLRNIDFSISKLAGTVARQIQVSGSLFDTSKLKLGDSGSSGFLGLIGGSKTSKTLFDLGINLAASSVGNIIANGISGSSYQIVQKIKTSNGFLGIGGGTKTTYTTTKGQIDPEITKAIQDVIRSLRDGLLSAADVIGLEGAEAILNSFQVSIGKISFKDMTGQEIEDQLNAIFSKVGDQMAGAIFPTLATMQKVGEGLFETFIRVAREYQVIDLELKSIGKEFGAVGVGSIAARDALIQLFDSLDDFVEKTDFFRDQFLSNAEQIAPVQASVIAELQRLGMAGVVTRDQFKEAVLGLDLTTQAGREMYAALLAVAPAFDKVLDYFDEVNKQTIQSLQQTADQFGKFADSLRKYRDTLFATDAAQGNAYALLRAKFITTAGSAATGDATALGGLEAAGKDFLTSAKDNASSWLQYQRDVALVARGVDQGIFAAQSTADYAQLQLAALQNAATILQTISVNTAATAAALSADVAAAQQAASGSPVPTPSVADASSSAPSSAGATTPAGSAMVADSAQVAGLTSELGTMRAELKAALEAIAISTGSMDRQLKRWDDGDALVITTRDGDDPIDVNLATWGGPGATS